MTAPSRESTSDLTAAQPRVLAFSPTLTWLFEGSGYLYATLTVDVVLLLGGLAIADAINPAPSATPAFLVSPLAVVFLAARRLYDPRAQITRLDRVAAIVGATATAAIVVAALIELTEPSATGADLIAIQFAICTALLVVWRTAWSTLRLRMRRAGHSGRRTLIVGAGEIGARIESHLLRLTGIGLVPVGFVDAHPLPPSEIETRRAPVLGSPAEFDAIVDETGAEHTIFAFQIDPDVTLRRLVRRCQERDLGMAVVPRLFDDATNRMVLEQVGGIPVFELRQIDQKGWQFSLKHGFDRVAAVLLLILLAPLLGAIALVVALSSGRPVLYRQRRVGRDGQVFDVLKFRSMRPLNPTAGLGELHGSDLSPGGVEGEDRRTGVGRFLRAWSLDEFPQLINVLRGEMSLIGPRPERPELVEEFARRVRRYEERHRVRSGITGWAQVNGLGPGTPLADKAEWDNWYIQNWSFWLDAKIMLMTVPAVLRRSE